MENTPSSVDRDQFDAHMGGLLHKMIHVSFMSQPINRPLNTLDSDWGVRVFDTNLQKAEETPSHLAAQPNCHVLFYISAEKWNEPTILSTEHVE